MYHVLIYHYEALDNKDLRWPNMTCTYPITTSETDPHLWRFIRQKRDWKVSQSQKVQFYWKDIVERQNITKGLQQYSHTSIYRIIIHNGYDCLYVQSVCILYVVDAGSRQGRLVQVIEVWVSHGFPCRDPLGRIVDQHFLWQRRASLMYSNILSITL